MNKIQILFLGAVTALASVATAKPLKALIVDGQNNHGIWPKSTIMMRQYLEDTGLYEVDIERSKFLTNSQGQSKWLAEAGEDVTVGIPGQPKTDPDFKPDFSKYDVVINNFGYKAAPWPEETQQAFESYVRNGGGFVSVHAADNCFPNWPEYNEMIGIGGWGGRNEKHGPYVYVNELGKVVIENTKGPGGGHGPKEEFVITMREMEHPINQGLPEKWMHTPDECYCHLRGPAKNLTVLGTAMSTKSKRNEPMLMTIEYHKGRVFHTTLGHDERGFSSVGFITTFLRGSEWAASGKVTQTEVPADFPTADKSSSRQFVYKK